MRDRAAALIPSRFLRFALSGAIAAAVNVLARIALSQLFGYSVSILIAFVVGMTTGYLLMKLLVFDPSEGSAHREYLRFGLVNLVALVQVWAVSLALARWILPAVGYLWDVDTTAHVIGVLSPIATSYLGHRSFTFANKNKHP